jgi:hypothetical protein
MPAMRTCCENESTDAWGSSHSPAVRTFCARPACPAEDHRQGRLGIPTRDKRSIDRAGDSAPEVSATVLRCSCPADVISL